MIRKEMLEYVKKKSPVLDGHIHTLNYQCTPSGFLGVRLPFHPWFLNPLEKTVGFFSRILPFKQKREDLKYLKNFVDMFNDKTQEEILLKKFSYEKETIEVILQMDMSVAIKGKQEKSQEEQMQELKTLKDKYPARVLLFVALDPNNPDCKKNFDLAFNKYDFDGVKIYPSLGYLPSHPVLMEIFKICEEKKIPVVSHCSSVCMKNSNRKLRIQGLDLDKDGNIIQYDNVIRVKRKEDLQFLNEPKRWLPVLMTYKRLKLNLAHFYGVEWDAFLNNKKSGVTDILDMMNVYENFRSDCSFTLHRQDFVSKIKQMMIENEVVRNKVLFGTDFYMILQCGSYRDIYNRFKVSMGDEIVRQLQQNNYRFYLGL